MNEHRPSYVKLRVRIMDLETQLADAQRKIEDLTAIGTALAMQIREALAEIEEWKKADAATQQLIIDLTLKAKQEENSKLLAVQTGAKIAEDCRIAIRKLEADIEERDRQLEHYQKEVIDRLRRANELLEQGSKDL